MTKSDSRVHWLDGARAFLITIGILLHASRIYDTSGAWLVHDSSSSPAFEATWRVIHIFRMPAFFIVAGFFCALSVRRHGAHGFLPRRFLRIGVPMLAIALTLNVAQDWLLHANATGRASLSAYLASERFAAFWRSANWHSHLWFLHYLLAYSALAWLWEALGGGRIAAALPAVEPPNWLWTPMLALTAFIAPAAGALLPNGYAIWLGLASPYSFLSFLPYFAFGYALFLKRDWLDGFARFSWRSAAALVLLAAAEAWLALRADQGWTEHPRFYIEAMITWSLSRGVFAAFRTLVRGPSPTLRYLSEASLSIYLFHHIFVVGLGVAFSKAALNVALEFAAIVGVTLAATLAIHHFMILRAPLLRLLFNGHYAARAA